MRIWKILMMVAVTAAVLCPERGGAADVIRDTFPDDQRAIAKTIRAILDTAERKELDRLASFHLYGPKFSKFDEAGQARLDAAAAQAGERRGLAASTAFKATADGLKVDVFGVTAVATFVMNYTMDTAEGKVTKQRRATMVFVKDGDKWKIVHEHFSLLNSAP